MTTLQWMLSLLACLFGLSITAAALAPQRPGGTPPAHLGAMDEPGGQPGHGPDGDPQHNRGEGRGPQPGPPDGQHGIPSDAPAAYKLEPGPYDFDQRDLTLQDGARGKELPVRVYVPWPKPNVRLRDAKLPLVVFSHGAGGSRDVGSELLGHWASHGYVVVAPTHADSIALQRAAGEKPDMDKTIASLAKPGMREERVRDCTLILDQIGTIEQEIPEIADRIDMEHIGLAGHSAGAMTTMIATGVQDQRNAALGDPRFDCALVLSGQGPGKGLIFGQDSWAQWALPALVMTGSLDSSSRTGQTAESRREPYELAPASGNKYLLFIEGATHMSFTGDAGSRLADRGMGKLVGEYLEPGGRIGEKALQYDQTAIFQVVRSASLAFLDAYLKDDQAARDYLVGDQLPELLPGVEWQHK